MHVFVKYLYYIQKHAILSTMTTVAEMGLAPGKSMRAYEDVSCLEIDHRGLVAGDREYMWVEAEPHKNVNVEIGKVVEAGHFLSQREDPALTGVIPLLQPGGLLLQFRDSEDSLPVTKVADTAANRIPVSVWEWNGEAVDQGDDAAKWGEEHLGRPVRLVAVSDEKPRYVEGDPALGRVGFADGHPITVGSVESLALINRQLASRGQTAISAKRSRATLLLAGLELPNQDKLPDNVFPEDYVEAIRVASNGLIVVLRRIKACERCPIPDTDHISGERKGRPVLSALAALGRHGKHLDADRYGIKSEIFWTQGFVIELPRNMPKDKTLVIARDAEVEVEYSNTTNWAPKQRKPKS